VDADNDDGEGKIRPKVTVNNGLSLGLSGTYFVTDDIQWTDGDFQLVSSDRVLFRVPSYHLFSAR
jgi:hypothetical protein